MSDEQDCRYLIPGLERGLKLLLAFSEQRRELTFAEMHRLVDMPKATAYRVVQTLEHMGFLERNKRSNTFTSGIRFYGSALNMLLRWMLPRLGNR